MMTPIVFSQRRQMSLADRPPGDAHCETLAAQQVVGRMIESSPLTADADASVAETRTPLQAPCAVALYIDADNQSPAIVDDLLASVCDDWRLEISRVVLAGNDHGQSIPRWQAALSTRVPEEQVLTLEVPRTPEAADLVLILELGAAMEQHRQRADLIVVLSRDDLLIAAAEAVRLRGCRVWVAYAQTEAAAARTRLPTLLLPAVNRSVDSSKPRAAADPLPSVKAAIDAPNTDVQGTTATHQQPQDPKTKTRLAQLRAQCIPQPGGGYLSSDVGQVLYQLGLTRKADRARFLRAVPGLREVGTGKHKRLLF
ncbi:hypothetical protein CKO42_23730 [Lamprobacter modestohalophilus]|uniref:NYN domain-containing protein n=2 Tax=Lamprobacter modestohalophilus TaxID=1064514 RepID=A0A9X0WD93_9GAMM|nr:hypothetical protein [Lamprobacter modestohalophilus]